MRISGNDLQSLLDDVADYIRTDDDMSIRYLKMYCLMQWGWIPLKSGDWWEDMTVERIKLGIDF